MAIETFLDLAKFSNILAHVYCLLPDHFHFVVSPNEDGISVLQFMDTFKARTTSCNWDLGWSGKLWQPRYYDHIVRSDESLSAICEYILQNPIRKGLVESVDDWAWCGTAQD
jgi:putative transposase